MKTTSKNLIVELDTILNEIDTYAISSESILGSTAIIETIQRIRQAKSLVAKILRKLDEEHKNEQLH